MIFSFSRNSIWTKIYPKNQDRQSSVKYTRLTPSISPAAAHEGATAQFMLVSNRLRPKAYVMYRSVVHVLKEAARNGCMISWLCGTETMAL
jgi:hypothetical protein